MQKNLIRIDKLACFKALWGYSILTARENIYALVSGDIDDDTYRGLLCTYYKTHSGFANYLDRIVIFGNQTIPLITRLTKEFRRELCEYRSDVEKELHRYRGTKFLLEDKEYLYFAVDYSCDYSQLEEVVMIV